MKIETNNWIVENASNTPDRMWVTTKTHGYQRNVPRHLLPGDNDLYCISDVELDRMAFGAFQGRKQPEHVSFKERVWQWLDGAGR